MTMPGIDDFRAALQKRLAESEKNGNPHCDVKAGDLHREVGKYPDADHRMPTCCEAMRKERRGRDRVLEATPSGYGANLVIRYMLPRIPSEIPQTNDFRAALLKRFAQAEKNGKSYVDIQSGDLHREVGIYPSSDHRMPVCCDVMRREMHEKDVILHKTPSGHGASLLIRYVLPRTES